MKNRLLAVFVHREKDGYLVRHEFLYQLHEKEEQK